RLPSLLTALLLLGACGQTTSDRAYLVVSVTGALADLQALRVYATIGNMAATSRFDGVPGQFALWLPPGARGTLSLSVDALDQGGCTSLSGHGQVLVSD